MHLNLVVIKKIGTIVAKCSVMCTIVPPIMFESDFRTTVSKTADRSCAWFPQ